MRKLICLLSGLLVFIAGIGAEVHYHSCVDSAMVHIMNQEYGRAHSYLQAVLSDDSTIFDASYMRLCVFATELLDYESYNLSGMDALQYADTVLYCVSSHLNSVQHNKAADGKVLFFKGNIFLYKSLILAKRGDWIQGVKHARKSVKILKQVIEMDSSFYDAVLPLGLYDYYIGQNLKWIPFMGLKIKGGVAEIEKAANTKSPFAYGAKKSLLEIYIERGVYDKADSLVSVILKQYPRNTIFLGIKAKIALLLKQYQTAFELGNELVLLSENRIPVNWTDVTAGYYISIASSFYMKDTSTCIQAIKKIQGTLIPPQAYTISYVKKHVNLIEDINKKINSN